MTEQQSSNSINRDKLRKKLKKFISNSEGEYIRNLLHDDAINSYKQKYSDIEYLQFMEMNPVSFEINGNQSINHPFYYSMFSVISQHVMGDCIKECLDKAMKDGWKI